MISTDYAYSSATTTEYKTQKVTVQKTYTQQTKKEYKNVVKEFKQRNPGSASHVDSQVRAGRNLIRNSGANEVSRSEMTMDEYKAFFKGLMDSIPFDSSQMNNTEIWLITEQGWEQMKNDPDYEAWVLGYTVENRSVHFPFQASNACVEKFGASIEEHLGQSFPKDTGITKTEEKQERLEHQKKKKEKIKEQELKARQRAIAKRKALQDQWAREHIVSDSRMQQYFAERDGGTPSSSSTTDQMPSKDLTNGIETYEMMVDLFQAGGNL